jgi:hypothetical protein
MRNIEYIKRGSGTIFLDSSNNFLKNVSINSEMLCEDLIIFYVTTWKNPRKIRGYSSKETKTFLENLLR